MEPPLSPPEQLPGRRIKKDGRMIKRKVDKFWFPWWPEKWLWGTIRIECTPAERGIWVDLLSLASKDDGYIRANEETPYPIKQLAGMLILPEKELAVAINKFVNLGKLIKTKAGTLYVAKWEKYQFSERHKRRIEEGMSEKKDTMPQKSALKNSTLNKNTLNKSKIKKIPMSSSFKNNIILKWNALAQKYNLAAIMEIKSGSLREKNLRARSADENFDFDLLVDMIDNSPFLLGKTKNPFFVFFDWIIKPTNYQKIIEGNYLDRQSYQKFSGIIEGIKDLKKQHEEGKKNES